jgi:hypothetical protein
MQVAVIVTADHPELTLEGDIHLVEAPWMDENYTYRRFFTQLAREGHYVILDNGAAVVQGQPNVAQLRKVAGYLLPKEIVAPDVMGHPGNTYKSVSAFLTDAAEAHWRNVDPTMRIMMVPQATAPEQWKEYYKRFVHLAETLELTNFVSIGVPKWLTWESQTRPELLASMEVAENIPHHLLGGGRFLIKEVEQASKVPYIRSIDTSVPVGLAIEGVELDSKTEIEQSYVFSPRQALNDVTLARQNIAALKEAAAPSKRAAKAVEEVQTEVDQAHDAAVAGRPLAAEKVAPSEEAGGEEAPQS